MNANKKQKIGTSRRKLLEGFSSLTTECVPETLSLLSGPIPVYWDELP